MSEPNFGAMAPGAAIASPTAPPPPKSGMSPLSPGGSAPVVVRGVREREPDVVNIDISKADNTTLGASIAGVADTLTFGYLDEAGAFIDSSIPEWLGGNGLSYDDNLRRNRMILDRYEKDHFGAFLTGQIAGGFVPFLGWGGRAKAAVASVKTGRASNLGRMTAEGAAYGALYGSGSSDGDLGDRFNNALYMGALGAGGSFVLGTTIISAASAGRGIAVAFRNGRPQKLDVKWVPRAKPVADDVAEDVESLRRSAGRADPVPSGNPRATPKPSPTTQLINRITGKRADEIEKGAIASGADLANPAKRELLLEAVSKLTPQAARTMAQSLEAAVKTGNWTKDPHFRSLLGLDLSEFGDEGDLMIQAAEQLNDISRAILEKAGMGTRSVDGMQKMLRDRFRGGLDEASLDEWVAKTKATEGGASLGTMVKLLAGAKFSRTTNDLLPEVLKGNKEARAELAKNLSDALRWSAKGQYLISSAGRNLGMLSKSRDLLFKQMADGREVEASADEVTERVKAAVDALGDDGLNELLNRVRDLSNLEEVAEVLLDPARAAKVGTWIRAKNTFESFIKSNTLTPMTGVINFVGAQLHYALRNPMARSIAARVARAEGNEKEALIYELANQASKAVRWKAQMEGFKAGLRRIKWEALDDLRHIAGVAGADRLRLKASASRQAMIAAGYRPPAIREYDLKARLKVSDVDAFNERLAARASSDAPLATLVNILERGAAVTGGVLDAIGTATAKVVSGTLDDYGRAMVQAREVYAMSAGHATEEAIRRNIPEDKLVAWVSKRTQELVDLPPEKILEAVERKILDGVDLDETDKFLLGRGYRIDKEADAVLFMDGPQTQAGKQAAGLADKLDTLVGLGQAKGILFPYIGTPTRILERGLVSYTPWGAKSAEIADILARGSPAEKAIERARMELGGTVMGFGMMLSAAGAITVTNGGYQNSKGLGGAPPNRLNLPGGGYVELSRLDPFAMTVALGAIIGQMYRTREEAGERYGDSEAISQAMAVAFHGVRDSILEKSYMTGARDLAEAISNPSLDAAVDYFQKLYGGAVARVLPASGTVRQVNETANGTALEAVGLIDQLTKVTPGMGAYLPTRIDPLGNEVDGRVMGLAAGTTADMDELSKRIADLGVNLTALKKADPAGFDLTSEELSELRRIRATEAINSDGLTMREALEELLKDPDFQSLATKELVQEAVVGVMGGFNEDAREIFEQRNQTYLADRETSRSFKAYMDLVMSPEEARAAAVADTEALGLTPTRAAQLE